jgi:O-antigen/teichoic acid export membrane protein
MRPEARDSWSDEFGPGVREGLASPHHGVSLGRRAAAGLRWQALATPSQAALQFVSTVLLARLLKPEDFGIVALALVFVDFVAVVAQLGISHALVQRKELTDGHVRAAWTLSIGIGCLGSIVLALSAPLLVSADAVPPLRALSISFLLTSLSTAAGGLLIRRLDFRSWFIGDVIANLVGYLVVPLSLALAGLGVWSLVAALLTRAALRSTLFLIMAPHSVRPLLRRPFVGDVLSFGTGMALAQVANYAARNGDYFIVGRNLGEAALGFYSRAYVLASLPASYLSNLLGSVFFSYFARVQDDVQRLKRGYLLAANIAALLAVPPMVLQAVTAPELVRVLFGRRWAPAILPLQILCVAGALRPFQGIGDALARGKGRVYGQLARHALYAVTVIAGALIGMTWGTSGVAVGVVAGVAAITALMTAFSLRLCNASIGELMRAVGPGFLIGGVVGALTLAGQVLLSSLRVGDVATVVIVVVLAMIGGLISMRHVPRRWLVGLEEVLGRYGAEVLPQRTLARLLRVVGLSAAQDAAKPSPGHSDGGRS